MLEVFFDDFMHMAQTSDPEQLLHFSITLLHGIHSVTGVKEQRAGYDI